MSDPTPTPAPSANGKPKAAGRGASSNVKLLLIGIVALFAILFIVLNTHSAKVNFVFGSTKISVIWVILLSIALGFLLGLLFPSLRRRRGSKKS